MREYHYPDFMPKEGELILVRDLLVQGWRSRVFCEYRKGQNFPWCTRTDDGTTSVWRRARPCSAMPEPVLYTEEDLPMPGQPILVRDDEEAPWTARIFVKFVAEAASHWQVLSPAFGAIGFRYAAHYDEQFWLDQQKKEPVNASKQAEKLAEVLARGCRTDCISCVRTDDNTCSLFGKACGQVTKEDWLAWAAKQED